MISSVYSKYTDVLLANFHTVPDILLKHLVVCTLNSSLNYLYGFLCDIYFNM